MYKKRPAASQLADLSDQLWIKLCVRKSDGAAFDLCQLTFQIAELHRQLLDASDQMILSTLVLAWSGLSAHVSFSEQIDVAVVLAHDHVVKILVIEALALAGGVACHLVVVQVDLHIIQVLVLECVKLFCFA
mgnify:FL=1